VQAFRKALQIKEKHLQLKPKNQQIQFLVKLNLKTTTEVKQTSDGNYQPINIPIPTTTLNVPNFGVKVSFYFGL